ncbi:MAG: restriction endonuclease subunit S [Defluviicoccus sp.]|nr:restriction endonuclease subunit S [Defluviicoccus sp.]
MSEASVSALLPTNINRRRLRFLFGTISGATPPSGTPEYWDGDIWWVTPEDLGNLDGREISSTRRTISLEGYKSCGTNSAKNGSLVLSKRAPIGQTAILRVDAACNQGCFLLTPNETSDERFFYYCLVHLRPLLEILGRGSTFMELSADDLRSVNLPYPDRKVQTRIADYLDAETGRIDALVAEKERMLALLEEKRAALISRAVTRGLDPNVPLKPSGLDWLGDIPAHWTVERLKFHLHRLEQGWSPQCDNYPAADDEWGVLKVGAVNSWEFNPRENKTLPDSESPIQQYEIRPRDVLMSRANTKELLGSVALVEDVRPRLLLCDKLYRLDVIDDRLSRRFLVVFLRSKPGRYLFEQEATGASGSMQNIGQDTVRNVWIPVPPKSEQQTIALALDRERRQTGEIEAALNESISLLKERRSALITAAVTGQIEPEAMRA